MVRFSPSSAPLGSESQLLTAFTSQSLNIQNALVA